MNESGNKSGKKCFYLKLPNGFCSGGMGDPPRSPRIPFTSPSPQLVNSSLPPPSGHHPGPRSLGATPRQECEGSSLASRDENSAEHFTLQDSHATSLRLDLLPKSYLCLPYPDPSPSLVSPRSTFLINHWPWNLCLRF